MALAFHFLGSPQLVLENLPVSVHRRSIVALLAYLAVNDSEQAIRTYPRESLSALLWPDYDQIKAFTNLRHILWEIQKTFGPGWLIANRETIGLRADENIWVDVHRFESLLLESQAQSDVSLRIPLLTESVKLYRHHFLTGFSLKNAPTFDEWSLTKADELRHKHTEALTLLAEDYCLLGDAKSALQYARRLVTLDPLNESAQRLLMQIHIQVGQHNAALKQYQNFEQTLRKELGLDPQPETRALYKQIRKGDVKHFQTGIHRETTSPWNNLPHRLTSFIGREQEQTEILGLVAKNRLVTLAGAGGVGKSRLALQVGEKSLSNFLDGVWLVELAPILDPLLVPRITAIAIGLRDEPQRPVIEMLCDYLHEKKTLIILDNCEHLLDACAQLFDALLKSCPYLKILATSREPLEIIGEAIYRVPSLEIPDFQLLLETLRNFESIKLFEQRAQLVQFNFYLTRENVSSVAQICHRLDGIPLAIELAAAKVGMISIEQIAKQLNENFNILKGGNRTDLLRHQTLRASIDWSWGLMTKSEQVFMSQLSVFVDSWNLESAEAVCDGDVLELNNSLVKKSLIVMNQEAGGQSRYRFHETIRQYANEKLTESMDIPRLRDRHLEYFLNLAETAAPHLILPEQLEWLSILDAEYENLRAALKWASSKETSELSLRLCAALGRYWNIRCYWLEGSKWLESALSKSTQTPSSTENTARVKALYHDAELASSLDNFERMVTSAKSSLKLAKEGTDRLETAIAGLYVGRALKRQGEHNQAAAIMQESLGEFRMLNASYWEAQTYRWLSEILVTRGDITISERISKNLRLARIAGERLTLANSLVGYAGILLRNTEEAMKHIEEADLLFRQVGSQFNTSYFILAELEWLKGEHQKANQIYLELEKRHSLIGEKYMRSDVIANIGLIAMEEGELLEAQEYFERALLIAEELKDRVFISWRLSELGKLLFLLGDMDNSKHKFKESISFAWDISPVQKLQPLILFISTIYSQRPEVSTRLLGALNALFQKAGRHIFDPRPLELYYDQAESFAHVAIPDAVFESVFADGQKMSMDEALDLMLKTVENM